MNINELMLGDFVRVHDKETEDDFIGRIYYLEAGYAEIGVSRCHHSVGYPYPVDCIEPIPLTPEILEKNGFKFDGSGQRSMMLISTPLFSEGIRYNIYVGLKKKTIEVFVAHPIEKSPNWRKSNKVYLEVCGCYVHELQRALRMCGINDLADNFKI